MISSTNRFTIDPCIYLSDMYVLEMKERKQAASRGMDYYLPTPRDVVVTHYLHNIMSACCC